MTDSRRFGREIWFCFERIYKRTSLGLRKQWQVRFAPPSNSYCSCGSRTIPVVASKKVLDTSANGFIAVWVVRRLSSERYNVCAAVRSESKGGHLHKTLASYSDKLELFIFPDISAVSRVPHRSGAVLIDNTHRRIRCGSRGY